MKKIPSKDEILRWISDNPTLTSKRDIARAFGIKGAARIDLKRILRQLEDEGHLTKRQKTYRDPDSLPPVSVLQVLPPNADGDLYAKPMEWQGAGAEPGILFIAKSSDPALKSGDRILARLTEVKDDGHRYEARLIRRIGTNPVRILGVFRKTAEGGRIQPIDKGQDKEWQVPAGAEDGAKDGELVEAQQSGPRARMGLPKARIVARLGDPSAPRAVSLIAIHQHGIPDAFPDQVIDEADAAHPATLGQSAGQSAGQKAGQSGAGRGGEYRRDDLRDIPLITIDPADARDHDDAIYAQPDDDPANPGGHVIWVAIADVAHYVTPGSALDIEARKRGNSTYFPDRVVPMLPDRLSGDLCSLHEGVDRACLAVRMVLDAQGNKRAHRFVRGLMKSHASLHYQEVQEAADGTPNAKCAPLVAPIIAPLYAAYRALKLARAARQPLDLDLPERKIVLSDEGQVQSVNFADRLDAHRLVEECMILANVATAEELIRLKQSLLFRVHEEPSPEKLDALREVAQASGFTLAKGQVLQTRHLNGLLAQAQGTEHVELVNISTLRSMTQAYYSPENFGHFGLALKNYAHFTSPIRRYSDLVVHRALIAGHGWGKDGLSAADVEILDATATHISETERRSMMAERDTKDRYLAAYLSERVGTEFQGRIAGIARFGVFVKLAQTGADGLVPISTIGAEYFIHDAEAQTITGEKTGLKLALGLPVVVRLAEAIPATGGLMLELLSVNGKDLPSGGGGGRGGGRSSGRNGRKSGGAGGRKPGRSRHKAAKIKKKVSRTRR